jgi:hypothetical protein
MKRPYSQPHSVMLKITTEAIAYILARENTLHFEYLELNGCCIPYQPEPAIRFGKPHNPEKYRNEIIEGINVYIPHALPEVPLTIKLSTFMGLKRLVVEGWIHA